MLQTLVPAIACFFVTLLAMLALRPLAIATDLLDRPGGRKMHDGAIPVVGGLAMFVGAVFGIGLATAIPSQVSAALLSACALLVTVGLMDDRFDLSPWSRLPAQIGAAALLSLGTGATVTTLGSPLGATELTLSGVGAHAFTILITVAAINAFNMLDGMDGLAGALAMVAFLAIASVAWAAGVPSVTAVSLVMLGAVAAFLVFNLPMRCNREVRCFMGDAGSTVLGLTVAWLAVTVSQEPVRAVAPVTVLWIVALPLYELIWSTVRRVTHGVSPFIADSAHFHHLLLQAGFGVRGAFGVLTALAAGLAALGIVVERQLSQYQSFLLLVFMGFVVTRLMCRAEFLWRLTPDCLRRLPSLTPGKPPLPRSPKR